MFDIDIFGLSTFAVIVIVVAILIVVKGIVIVNPNGGTAGAAPPRYVLPAGERFVDADGQSWSGTIEVPAATGFILRRG